MVKFEFSFVGLIYLLMLFIPNMIWIKHKPAGYEQLARHENKVLLTFEKFGQVLVTCSVIIFNNINLRVLSLHTIWFAASIICMMIYEIWWMKYFTGEHSLEDFYSSFLGIPVPGALFPVSAFILLGIYEKNMIIVLSAVILGIGHIGIHIQNKAKIHENLK